MSGLTENVTIFSIILRECGSDQENTAQDL